MSLKICLCQKQKEGFFKVLIFHLRKPLVFGKIIRPLVDGFNGNADKSLAQFYGLLIEDTLPLKFKDITFTNILIIEDANHLTIQFSEKNTYTTSEVNLV